METLDGLRRKLKPEEIVSHFPLRILGENSSQWPTHQQGAMVGMRNSGTVCLGREETGGGVLSKSLSFLV